MFPQSLGCFVCLVVVSSLVGLPVFAGESGLAKVRAPVCVRGDCRPGSGAQMQGVLLQTAALSVASGAGRAQGVKQKLGNLPQSRKARLPSWYKRAQAAELRGQAASVQQVRAGPVQPRARTRVREPETLAASGRSQGRERARQGRAVVSATTTSEAPRVRSAAGPRPEMRGARHRRLVQESLDAMDAMDNADNAMDWEAGAREPRSVSARSMPDPVPLVSANFTRGIKANLSGNYKLAEPVTLGFSQDLPLGNETHPFRGTLRGTAENSLEVRMDKPGGGDLHVFGSLESATIDLSVKDSSLSTIDGSVALFGGFTNNSDLTLRVRNSELIARGGKHAALVARLEENNKIDLMMSDSNLTLSGGSAGEGPLVAGPVARTFGGSQTRSSMNTMRVHDSSGNRVQAEGQHSPVVASLGWGHLDIKNCRSPCGFGFRPGSLEDRLEQSNLTGNHVGAHAQGSDARAHASMAGSYGQEKWHGEHRLQQRGVSANTISANGSDTGLGLASLGLVHDLKNVTYSKKWNENEGAVFSIQQTGCSNNTVTGSAGQSTEAGSGPVASLSMTSDYSGDASRSLGHLWVVQNNLSNNKLQNGEGSRSYNGSRALVGSFELRSFEEANHVVGCVAKMGANPALSFPYIALFLFSGGEHSLPLSRISDSVLDYAGIDARGEGCSRPSIIDEAAYKFSCDTTARNCRCLREGQCEGTVPNPGEARRVQVIVNSTNSTDWEKVNQAFCKTVPLLFEGKDTRCDSTTPCHNPGETFHSLVPSGDEEGQWLLVTRQTWPAGSQGNMSDVELFRAMSFSLPGSSGGTPQWNGKALGVATPELGQFYTGGRVVTEGGGPLFALADNNTLLHFYQAAAASDQAHLRWTRFPLDTQTKAASFERGTDWPLPPGGQLMLVSQEDDGVNLWVKQAGGVVKRFALEEIKQQGENATETSTFTLRSASNGEVEPLALARHEDWLYSLQATGLEDEAGKEFQIQRWNISNATAAPDPDWSPCVRAMVPGRLVISNSTVLQVPEGSLAANGSTVFKPRVPEEGGCLNWQTLSPELMQCGAQPLVAGASDGSIAAVATLLALVPTAGCVALAATVYAHKMLHKKKRSQSNGQVPFSDLQETSDAASNIYDEVDPMQSYEPVDDKAVADVDKAQEDFPPPPPPFDADPVGQYKTLSEYSEYSPAP